MRNDLRLLDGRLKGLAHAPFFRTEIKEYLANVREVIASVESSLSTLDEGIARLLIRQIWSATRYLSGSVSREIPYEIVYGLEQALADWQPSSNFLVTTSYLSELGYHFEGIDPIFYQIADQILGVKFKFDLVQVALPHLYKHLPIHNAVLYHELGHFVDNRIGVSNTMVMSLSPHTNMPVGMLRNHCREHFADLFGASYVGTAMTNMLQDIAPGHGQSLTHPATADRVGLLNDFLTGTPNSLVDVCNGALKIRGKPSLSTTYVEPSVDLAFDNIVPHRIQSVSEVHGLLPASRNYLLKRLANKVDLWATISDGDVTRIINDLVEKSIRNWMISERWKNASLPKN